METKTKSQPESILVRNKDVASILRMAKVWGRPIPMTKSVVRYKLGSAICALTIYVKGCAVYSIEYTNMDYSNCQSYILTIVNHKTGVVEFIPVQWNGYGFFPINGSTPESWLPASSLAVSIDRKSPSFEAVVAYVWSIIN